MVIYNGLTRWQGSYALTHWNTKGGASTVDCLMGSPSLIPDVRGFTISSRPIGIAVDHAYLSFTLVGRSPRDGPATHLPRYPRYQFTCETVGVYRDAISDGLFALDPHSPLDEITRGLGGVLHASTSYVFPCTMIPSTHPPRSTAPQNTWYDDECRETGA